MIEDQDKNGEIMPSVKAREVGPVTPTNQAIYEAGKSMLIESVSTGREFCKFMIGTSMSAIPIYLALLKFVLPDEYVPTVGVGILALVPAVLFLVAGIIFLVGYFPQQGFASLDIPAEIERERRTTVKRRQRIGFTGFTVFCVAVVAGLLITGCMLGMPRGAEHSGGTRVAPTSRLAGPLRSQDRPRIGRGDPSADGLRVFVGRTHT